MPDARIDFQRDLQAGKKLVIMPVPRLLLDERIDQIDQFVLYPARDLDIAELNIVSYPAYEYRETKRRGYGSLPWLQSGATQVEPEDLSQHALIAFTAEIDWDSFLSPESHKTHKDLIRHLSETAEAALDLIRFDFCRLDLPEALPGRVGSLGNGSPYSTALLYALEDNESYIVAGEVLTHQITAGVGLEISAFPAPRQIGDGEVGRIARQALALLSMAMESNTQSTKFVQCISLLEFLADPESQTSMKDVRKEITSHIARSKTEYHRISKQIREGFFEIRHKIVHEGVRLEDQVPDIDSCRTKFQLLQQIVGKTIDDFIDMSDQEWGAITEWRRQQRIKLGVDPAEKRYRSE